MDNEKTINRKIGSMIAKNLILLLSVAVVGVIGAWSWFLNNAEASAEGISVKCEAPEGIEIAVVEHGALPPSSAEYSTSITLDKDCAVLKNLKLTEVTSDGTVFLKPQLQQQNGIASPVVGGDWSVAYEGRDYICFDLYIRSESPMKIFLNSASSLETAASNLTGSGSENISNYGEFSKDCVVGAARVSVLSSDSSKRNLLWIPRPDLKLVQDGTLFSVEEGIQSGITDVHKYWNTEQELLTDDDTVASIIQDDKVILGNSKEITQLTAQNSSDGYYYNSVVYNVWIEGEDSEARLALAGGEFEMNIKLAGEKIN